MARRVTREMQEKGLINLTRVSGGFNFTDTFFPYTSGKIGPYFVQSAAIKADGRAYSEACRGMACLVREVLDNGNDDVVITGGETRDWIFSLPVACDLSLPHTMLYKDGKMLGADLNGKEAIHVADLNNEGSSPRDMWKPMIEKANGNINHIFFYVDRMENGVDVMHNIGLQRHAFIELDAIAWDYLQKNGIVSDEVYRNLQSRTADPEEWAVNMLRSEKGLYTFGKLLQSEKTRDKARKILDVGYPELKDEMNGMILERFGKTNGWMVK